ncbi:condensation domain-containing protein, partial [Streptomyces sp. NPDC057638]|uniref:condensation domain-containing protein n=1 Tax=Streptomyces sp. NPDC057638 TaxID=3346190 RepID=UPI003679D863
EQKVTVLNQTPSAFYQLIDASHTNPALSDQLTLRTVILAGEALDPTRLSSWYDLHPHTHPVIVDMYGPTEATVYATHHQHTTDTLTTPTIGRPIPGTHLYVLDATLRPTPPGVTGELYISGQGLARGYLHRPALTAERFTANPYGPPGSRMYRTGDLARWNHDHTLTYLGRTDHQVKIRGFRIELGEIENALVRLPEVARAAAHAHTDPATGTTHLTGYVVPVGTVPVSTAALRHALARRLPAPMVPAAFVILAELPLTTSGKLDRQALPAPDFAAQTTNRPPRTPHEKILATLFAETLNLPTVGIDDNFFELGGHSLLATQLTSRIRTTLNTEIPVRTLFDAPTITQLAPHLDHHTPLRPTLTPQPRPHHIPLSHAQQRLWFLHQLEGPTPTYNLPFIIELTGKLDHTALQHALNDLIERHETLRTTYPDNAGTPYQKILPVVEGALSLTVERIAWEDIPRRLDDVVGQGFDIASEPPLRAYLFATAPQRHTLALVIHHIAADGESLQPLLNDLFHAY